MTKTTTENANIRQGSQKHNGSYYNHRLVTPSYNHASPPRSFLRHHWAITSFSKGSFARADDDIWINGFCGCQCTYSYRTMTTTTLINIAESIQLTMRFVCLMASLSLSSHMNESQDPKETVTCPSNVPMYLLLFWVITPLQPRYS